MFSSAIVICFRGSIAIVYGAIIVNAEVVKSSLLRRVYTPIVTVYDTDIFIG